MSVESPLCLSCGVALQCSETYCTSCDHYCSDFDSGESSDETGADDPLSRFSASLKEGFRRDRESDE